MKTETRIANETLPADLALLVERLEPSDLPRIELAYRGLSGLHAVLSQILAPKSAAPRMPIGATELNELDGVVMKLEQRVGQMDELLEKVVEELTALNTTVIGLSARMGPPSSERLMVGDCANVANPDAETPTEFEAERRKWVATGGDAPVPPEAAAVAQLAANPAAVDKLIERLESDDLVDGTPPVRAPAPPSANGSAKEHPKAAAARQRRLAIAKHLADGPRRAIEICRALQIPDGSISALLSHEWFAKTGPLKDAPWGLTDAGRAALTEAGYVLVSEPPAETKPAEPPAPKTELKPGAFVPGSNEKQDRAKKQLHLIAETIAASELKMLTLDEIAKEAGLPPEVVAKRLRHYGPDAFNQSVLRYFVKTGAAWTLTDAGKALAKEAVLA